MTVIRTWFESWDLPDCVRCGGLLEPVDDELRRHCPACGIYILPAKCELHEGEDLLV